MSTLSTLEILMIFSMAVTAVAVVVQMCVLIGMFGAIKRSSQQIESVAGLVQAKAVPLLETAQKTLDEYRPKVELLLNNLAETSTAVKEELARVEGAVNEVIDRSRLQVIRVDEMLSRTLDKVEDTTDRVQQTVAVPVRQASGVIQGISVGLSTLFHKGNYARGKAGPGIPKEDMFI